MAESRITAIGGWFAGGARWLRGLAGAAVVMLVAGCGGGEGTAGSNSSAAGNTPTVRALAATEALASLPDIAVVGLTKIRETRIGRTEFEYEFRVSLQNTGPTATDVVATLVQVGSGTQIVDGVANFGSVDAGRSATSLDTVVLRQNRLVPFNQGALVWSVSGKASQPLATFQFASSVPAVVRDSIVEVVSTVAAGQIGTAMPIDDVGKVSGSTVFAVNGSGDLVLAGSAKPGAQVQLSAESTALELMRLSMPALPGIEGRDSYDQFVTSTPSFAALAAAVAGAQSTGDPLSQSNAVNAALQETAREIETRLRQSRSTTQGVESARRRALAIVEERPNRPVPISVIRIGGRSVHLTDGEGLFIKGTPKVLNSTPLFWNASVSDHNGVVLSPAKISLSPASLLQLLSNPLDDLLPIDVPIIGLTQHDLPSTNARSFSLAVMQDGDSIAANVGSMLIDLFDFTSKFTSSKTCSEAFARTLFSAEDLVKFVEAPSRPALALLILDAAGRLLRPTFLLPTELQTACLKGATTFAPVFARFLRIKLRWLSGPVAVASIGLKVLTIIDKAILLSHVAHPTPLRKDVGICLDRDGKIRNCAASFVTDPESYLVTPGALIRDWKVRAFDDTETNTETGVPVTLTAELDNKTVAESSGQGAISVRALTVGDAKLNLLDPATGARGTGYLHVREPRFSKSKIGIAVGESTTVEFVDSSGARLDFNGPTHFYTVDGDKVTVGAGPQADPQTPTTETELRITAKKEGRARVFAHNVALNNVMELEVDVVGSAKYSGLLSFTGTIQRADVPCFNGTMAFFGAAVVSLGSSNDYFLWQGRTEERAPCFSRDKPDDTPPITLTRIGQRYRGSVESPYDCLHICFQRWDVDLEVISDVQGQRVVGTVWFYHYYSYPPAEGRAPIIWSGSGPFSLGRQNQ